MINHQRLAILIDNFAVIKPCLKLFALGVDRLKRVAQNLAHRPLATTIRTASIALEVLIECRVHNVGQLLHIGSFALEDSTHEANDLLYGVAEQARWLRVLVLPFVPVSQYLID